MQQLCISTEKDTCIYDVLYSVSRGNQDAYDTNKMAEEFTHSFFDQAFSVGQQVFYIYCILQFGITQLEFLSDLTLLREVKSEIMPLVVPFYWRVLLVEQHKRICYNFVEV